MGDGNIGRQAGGLNISYLSRQPQATLLFWAPVAGSSTSCPPTLPRMPPLPTVFLSLILDHLFSVLHQNRTSQLHNTVSSLSLLRSFLTLSFLASPNLSLHPTLCLSPPHPFFRLYNASSTFFWWKLVMYACMSR